MSLITECVDEMAAAQSRSVASAIVGLCERIAALPDLRPSPLVNGLFDQLVHLVVDTPEGLVTDVLEEPDLRAITQELRNLAGRAEIELECQWSRRVAAADQPGAELRRFPYLENYRKLCRVEAGLVAAALRNPPRRVAFLGCGPLPLTPLILSQDLSCPAVGIDRDETALAAAAGVADAIGAPDVDIRLADAASVDASGFDVVVLAALVGATDDEKRTILTHLAESMSPHAVLIARSAHGLRTLLYPPIPEDALAGFDVRGVVRPVSDVVNSVVLARPAR